MGDLWASLLDDEAAGRWVHLIGVWVGGVTGG